jgi:hypothetical protein
MSWNKSYVIGIPRILGAKRRKRIGAGPKVTGE